MYFSLLISQQLSIEIDSIFIISIKIFFNTTRSCNEKYKLKIKFRISSLKFFCNLGKTVRGTVYQQFHLALYLKHVFRPLSQSIFHFCFYSFLFYSFIALIVYILHLFVDSAKMKIPFFIYFYLQFASILLMVYLSAYTPSQIDDRVTNQ